MKTSFVLSTALVISLVGCGGSGGGNDDNGSTGSGSESVAIEAVTGLSGNYRYLGFVELIQDDLEDRVNRDTNFLELTGAQGPSVFRNSVPQTVDTCKLLISNTIPTDVGVIGFPDAPFNLVSAGDTFTLSNDAGTYANVVLSEDRFDIAPYPTPENLTLDIPGAAFPSFSNVSIPQVASVTNFLPGRNQTLQPDGPISWTPTGIENHTINLVAIDFAPTGEYVDLRCHVADDGTFALPAEISASLTNRLGADYELEGMQQERRSDALIIKDDALLVVTRRIETL